MDKYIKSMAVYLKRRGELDDDQEEIIIYSLTYIVLSICSIIGIIVISALLRVLPLAIATSLAAATLRLMSGGAHFSTANRCAIMSGITFPSLAWLSSFLSPSITYWLRGVAFLFSTIVFLKYAPVDNEAKPIKQERKKFFRIGSIVILIIWVGVSFILEYSLANAVLIGVMWQTTTLTPLGRRIYGSIDQMWEKRR
jgi:accessory gene regulator B